jgi:hypothetical protein
LNVGRRVRHGNLARYKVTEIREVAAEPLLVRVQHASKHQFAAGVEQFDVHEEVSAPGRCVAIFAFGVRPSRGKGNAQPRFIFVCLA